MKWARANVIEVTKQERNAYSATLEETTNIPVIPVFGGGDVLFRDDVGRNARSIIEALKVEAERAAAQAEGRMRTAVNRGAQMHTRNWTAAVRTGAQIDITALLRDDDLVDFLSVRSEQFNALIKNLTDDIRHRIERETLGAIFEGRSNADIAKSLTGIEGIGRGRARLIARDQASKMNGAMNEFRQRQAGITHYRWKSMNDPPRARENHRARNGKVFAWDKPPSDGNPGKAINCRCRALAVLVETPEDAEELLPGDPSDMPGDPVELIAKAGSTSSQDVLSWPRDLALTRHAEVRRAQEALVGYRASATEIEAESLFSRVYGFGPEGQDLAAIARMPAGRAAVSTRKTLLFGAVKARLDMVEDLLAHAAETAPIGAAVPQRLPLPKLPAGPYLARGLGQARPIEDALADGRAIVLDQGRLTRHEWGFAHDQNGRHLVTMSSGKPSQIEFNRDMVPELYSADFRVTYHHNHPRSSSFSRADLVAFKQMPGLDTLYAHGHNGSSYRVRVIDRARIDRFEDIAMLRAQVYLTDAAKAGRISVKDANLVLQHVRMLALFRKLIVDYGAELSGATALAAHRNAQVIEDAVTDIAAHIPD